jgi:hypothetical protein
MTPTISRAVLGESASRRLRLVGRDRRETAASKRELRAFNSQVLRLARLPRGRAR